MTPLTNKDKLQETLIYLVLWSLLFAAPVLSLYIRTASDNSLTFDWNEVLMVWRQCGIFFVVFLAHNYLLAPILVYRQQRARYFTIVTVLVAIFAVYQCTSRPVEPRHGPRPNIQRHDQPVEPQMGDNRHQPHDFNDRQPHRLGDGKQPSRRPDGMTPPDGQRPPMHFSQHDIVATIILILMMFANLGIKLYFKQATDRRHIADMEHKNLEQQLEYLKYQLNPHFLMNTLNNIHALVDIDPEQSKEAIIQLSKILRYVLYDSNHKRVSMSKEHEFMDNYIRLMRMRYTDKLQFTVNYPEEIDGATVPPLLFISFVENAFKHGVSYQEPSFIDIAARRYQDKHGKERLQWTCRNSLHNRIGNDAKGSRTQTTAVPRQGGVGLANVRQRLSLIYGSNYSLGVKKTADTYEATLDIPLN